MRALLAGLLVASAAAAQQPAKWRLVEEWRVGGEVDGPHSFADTRGMGVLADGRIALIDYKDAQLYILDAKGQPLRTVGRKGAGPGEFDRPNGLVVSPTGEIIVNDPVGNNRLTVFAANGDFIRTIPIVNRWGYGYTWDAFFNAAGRLDEYVSVRRGGATEATNARRIWSANFASIDTIMPPTCPSAGPAPDPRNFIYEFRSATRSRMMSIPYVAPRISMARAQDGATWIGGYPGYGKITHTPAGKCESDFSITLRGTRVRIPAAVRDSAIEMVRSSAAGYADANPDFGRIPTEFTAYDALFLDQSKRLWVDRLVDARTHRVEVYSPTGALIAEADLPVVPRGGRPVIITNDRMLCFIADEDDLLHLVSLRIVR